MFTHNINFTLRLIFAIIKIMKITLKENKIKNDIEVIIEYPEMSETVNRIEHAVKSVDNSVRCFDDDENICFVRIVDIFYIESVEKRIFIYTKDKVYRAEMQLYQYAEKLYSFGFEQISKTCILNINMLASVKPIFNSKMEALLENGEKVIISRNFIATIKRRLEKML